jgi:hypothetical protein
MNYNALRNKLMLITRVLLIEAGAIPLMSNTPKFLRIGVETIHGPLDVRISESAALELTAELNTHFQGPGYRSI